MSSSLRTLLLALLGLCAPVLPALAVTELSWVRLPAPPAYARASADGKLLLVQTPVSGPAPARLVLLDATDPQEPLVRGTLDLSSPAPVAQMALSADGRQALVLQELEAPAGLRAGTWRITAVDLADPMAPRQAWQRELVAAAITLAAQANAYAYESAGDAATGKATTAVVSTRDSREQPLARLRGGFQTQLALSADGRFLARAHQGRLQRWDLRQAPARLQEQKVADEDRHRCIAAVLDSGHVVMEAARRGALTVYGGDGDAQAVPPVARLFHGDAAHCTPLNPQAGSGRLEFAGHAGRVQALDVRQPGQPALERGLQLPRALQPLATAGTLVVVRHEHAAELGLFVADGAAKDGVDWRALEQSHGAAVQAYRAGRATSHAIAAADAARQLEAAGVLQALDAPILRMPSRRAAALFNDYGFLAHRAGFPPRTVEAALRRAMMLDPEQAAAHVNLADSLFEQVQRRRGDPRSDDVLLEVESHYQRYLTLGGPATGRLAGFLRSRAVPAEGEVER